jgi:hypothetical protein
MKRSPNHCPNCGAELVIRDPQTSVVWPYGGLTWACPSCDGPLELVDVVRGWYRRKGEA